MLVLDTANHGRPCHAPSGLPPLISEEPLKPLDLDASRKLLHREVERAGLDPSRLDSDSTRVLLEQLDGLPLAIELAAAGLRTVGVRDLISRWRDDEPPAIQPYERHRSIASAMRSTFDQLDAAQIQLLVLCCLFPSDFDSDAISALAGKSVVPLLLELCDQSLLEVDPAVGRYRMLVPIRSEVRAMAEPPQSADLARFISYFESVASRCLEKMKGTDSLAGVAGLQADLSNIAAAFNLADDEGNVSAMATIVHCVGLANGMSPAVGAKGHLRNWVERLRVRCSLDDLDDEVLNKAQTSAAWGLYGSNDGAWYLRWETDASANGLETMAMAAIARFSRGESVEAWELLRDLDLTSASDPYMRAMLCGVGAVIAFEVGAVEGLTLADAAASAAREQPSHGASFFAGLARSAQMLVHGDAALSSEILVSAAESIDGHGLLTLENMGLAGVAMTVGFILQERDPAGLLVGLLDRYLEQHSLDPASVAMTLDVAALQLDSVGATENAAMLIGLLDRLGLSMAILRGPRVALEAKIAGNPEWEQVRAAGATMPTFDVLRSVRTALARRQKCSGIGGVSPLLKQVRF